MVTVTVPVMKPVKVTVMMPAMANASNGEFAEAAGRECDMT